MKKESEEVFHLPVHRGRMRVHHDEIELEIKDEPKKSGSKKRNLGESERKRRQ